MLPFCSPLATLASIGKIFHAKIRAVRRSPCHLAWSGPFLGSSRVRLGVGLGVKEEGEEGGLRKARNWGSRSLAEDKWERV